MTKIHLARFGERAGEHALLAHSGADRDLLTEAQFRSDVPPQGDTDAIGVFVTGYRLDAHYIVQRTKPDSGATRPGMVATTSLILPVAVLGAISLDAAFDYLRGEPDAEHAVDAALFHDRGQHEHPPGAAALASALLAARRAIWPGGDGISAAVACLWRHLPEEERHRLTFGAAFHPAAINIPVGHTELVTLSVPAAAGSRWPDWPVIDPGQPAAADPVRDAFFGSDDGAARRVGADLLGRDVSFDEWRHLVTISQLERNLDTLDHERVRSLLQLVGLVAPVPTAGARVKARALDRLADLTAGAGFDDIRGLRGIPWTALPAVAIRDLLLPWASAAVGTDTRMADVADAITEVTTGTVDTYRDELHAALRDALAAAEPQSWRGVAEVTLRLGAKAVDWLVDAAPKPALVDTALAAAASPPTWLAPLARKRRLPATHAASVDVAEPVAAWRAHIGLRRRPAAADAALAGRVGAVGTVAAALALDDTSLTSLAADLVATTPALLPPPIDVADRRTRALWSEAVTRGADPWAAISATHARTGLLDAVLEGDAAGVLVDALSRTAAADISGYPRRADVWNKLSSAPRARMLSATANALGRRLRPGDPTVEPELAEAILDPDLLGAIAHDDPAQAVHLLDALPASKAEHAVVIAQRGRFDPPAAAAFGDLVVARRWKRAAESITDLAAMRPDLKTVASRVAVLFSALERLRRWAGISDGVRGVVTRGELRDALCDLVASLYTGGPSDRSIWERAGGHAADCPDGVTARHRWGLALAAIEDQRSGAPALRELLQVMIDEYPNNGDLQRLADAMTEDEG